MVIVCVILWSPHTRADKYDLQLSRLLQEVDGSWTLRGEGHFKELMKDVGLTMRPSAGGPRSTRQFEGVRLVMDYGFSTIDKNSESWQAVMTDHDAAASEQAGADGALTAQHVHLQGGLPYSFMVGATVSMLSQSELCGTSLEAQYTAFETIDFLPELLIRGYLAYYTGSEDYALSSKGFDLLVSKTFRTTRRQATITPYAGLQATWLDAKSNVFVVDVHEAGFPIQATLDDVEETIFMGSAGAQFGVAPFTGGFELDFSGDQLVALFRAGVEL